jgi:flagellar motor switch protein FliM
MLDTKLKDTKKAVFGVNAIVKSSCYRKDPNFQDLFEQFCTLFSKTLNEIAGVRVQCVLKNAVVLKFNLSEDFFWKESESILIGAETHTFKSCVILCNELTFSLMELLLGNTSHHNIQKRSKNFNEKPPTLIEQTVIKQISKTIFNCLVKGLNQSVNIVSEQIFLEKGEYKNILNFDLPFLCCTFELNLGVSRGTFCIFIPYIEEIFDNNTHTKFSFGRKDGSLLEQIKDVAFWVDCVIPDKNLKNLYELLKLQVGETFILDHNVGGVAMLRCEGLTLAECELGEINSRIAASITTVLI